jgi:hypothetical protein
LIERLDDQTGEMLRQCDGERQVAGNNGGGSDLYLTTHNTHKRQTSMSPAGFEPTITASERFQTYALDGAATAIEH